MKKEQILDIFYNQILKEAGSGEGITIGDWHYAMQFSCNTIANNQEFVIQVHQKEKFDELLSEYATIMLQLIKTDSYYHKFDNIYFVNDKNEIQEDLTIKAILTFIWANAGFSDFLEPEHFLMRRIQFVKNGCSLKLPRDNGVLFSYLFPKYGELPVYGFFEKNSPVLENLYSFSCFVMNNDGEKYLFPKISFGLSNNTCYIGCIQNKKMEKGKFQKDLDRSFYKVDRGVPEELKNISPGVLLSLTVFFELLKYNNITDVIFNSYYPLRNQIKEAQIEKYHKVTREDYNRILTQMVNREITSFVRLQYHFKENICIHAYPFDIDSFIHIKLSNSLELLPENILGDFSRCFQEMCFEEKRNFQRK